MDALLKTLGAATLVTTATAAAMAQTPAGPITSADAAMRYYLSLEDRAPAPVAWLAPPAASGLHRTNTSAESADQRLDEIVRGYTRDRLGCDMGTSPRVRPSGTAASSAQNGGYRSWFDWPEIGSGAGAAADAGLAAPSPR